MGGGSVVDEDFTADGGSFETNGTVTSDNPSASCISEADGIPAVDGISAAREVTTVGGDGLAGESSDITIGSGAALDVTTGTTIMLTVAVGS